MTVIRRNPTSSRSHHGGDGNNSNNPLRTLMIVLSFLCFILFIFLLIIPDNSSSSSSSSVVTTVDNNGTKNNNGNIVSVFETSEIAHLHGLQKLRGISSVLQQKRQQIQGALKTLTEGNIPARLRVLREKHEIVGERINEIRTGKETVHEILHGHDIILSLSDHKNNEEYNSDKPPMELNEIITYLDAWIHQLHTVLVEAQHATFEGVWQAYHDLAVKTLYPWDREYLTRMPERRNDGSIFLSVASYRDETCNTTLYHAFQKAKNPDKIYVGLVQQNCHKDCKSGVLPNLTMADVPPDLNCYELFCSSDIGQGICKNNQIRVLNIDEPESLGPYAARFFTSKLWYGEPWFMQIDAHMTFANHWDSISIEMLEKTPSKKPVLSHYPPSNLVDLDKKHDQPTSRLCGPVFATSDLEEQIIRLEGAGIYDKVQMPIPAFAPFTAAGYFVAHADFLREVPFDPFLPWIFMGEEIIMSSRLWTAGYDIFGPNQAVVGHWYIRKHKPKFWESVHRAFGNGIFNPLQALVLDRIKYQLGYPEADRDMLRVKSILTAVEQYGMGTERSLDDYLRMVGMNMTTKEITYTEWCEKGYPPPGFEQYDHLYPGSQIKKQQQQQ